MTVDDYVAPVERRASWIVGAIAFAVGLVPLLRGGRGADALLAGGSGVGAVAVVVCASLLARAIVSRPQRADSTVALAWDDALRADVARTVVGATAGLALFSLAVSLPISLSSIGVHAGRDVLQMGTLWGALAVFLTVGIWSMRQRPARYFLRRLWPQTAAEADANERAAMGVQL